MLAENPALFENTQDFLDMRGFLNIHDTIINPIIGNHYVPISIKTLPIAKVSNLDYIDDMVELVSNVNGKLCFNTVVGIKEFPEGEHIGGDQLQHTILFDTSTKKDQFVLLYRLKFSTWRLSFKDLLL
jgi:hypothetical protein